MTKIYCYFVKQSIKKSIKKPQVEEMQLFFRNSKLCFSTSSRLKGLNTSKRLCVASA